ncbi:sugar transferase [Pontivivens ytuae]|uniref:Sugar transferase n=1 Tax=Pontivivens ytuae TaxID=2789856 RepID=A0A7S9LVW5_9RHOB|nr:sugar transferase [Pontivivens ytuae]
MTGASGFVGRQLVPILRAAGAELVLVGRDPDAMTDMAGPGVETCGYDALAELGRGADALLHLAVLNNDRPGSEEEFRAVNVTLLGEVVEAARTAGISTLLNATTIKVGTDTPYGRSKAEGEALLASVEGLRVVNLRFAAVYGDDTYRGTLAHLYKLPAPLRPTARQALGALRPTVHVSRVAEAVLRHVQGTEARKEIVTDTQSGNRFYAAGARIIDYGFALTVILLLWWLLILVWLMVRIGSPGPGIFAQERVGRKGHSFTCYKFRTMQTGTAQRGTHEIAAAAVTPLGAVLRRAKIDELPQVVNILRGELSLVGPRPCLPVQTELVEARRVRGVLDIRPGITGWAQIQDIDMSAPVRLAETDRDYVALRSLLLDLRIILATATGGGRGDRVNQAPTESAG